ncbi:hypothetical protein NL30_15265 [Burkholderia contaminans]|nr:hypothetical protein NL30_15265 [Burkholderia contaminans]
MNQYLKRVGSKSAYERLHVILRKSNPYTRGPTVIDRLHRLVVEANYQSATSIVSQRNQGFDELRLAIRFASSKPSLHFDRVTF